MNNKPGQSVWNVSTILSAILDCSRRFAALDLASRGQGRSYLGLGKDH
jgi:hypothetical protein